MRRRDLLGLLGGAAVSWPEAGWAQQAAVPVVGFLASYALDQAGSRLAASFRDGLKEVGFEDRHNVRIEYTSANNDYGRLPGLAAELVAHGVSVIAAVGGSPAALAAKAASTSVPIVFQIGVDPIQFGLIASLNRPGANVTGIVNRALEVGPKRIELLRELLPRATKLAHLVNPALPAARNEMKEMDAAARTLGFELHLLQASSETDFSGVFTKSAQLGVSGLVISGDPFFNTHSEQLATLALSHSLPAAYQFRDFAAAGGLVSYGSSLVEAHRETGIYTGRVLKGEKPKDLPVQQSTKVELIINMKTAKALNVTVPITLLGRADEVIE